MDRTPFGSSPKISTADLDVHGLIRTGQGIEFPDGSIQRSAAMPSIVRMRPSNPESDKKLQPKSEISGAGTTNQVTKWLDGPDGHVGDSAIAEVGGKVGIGTINPGGQLHIYGVANHRSSVENEHARRSASSHEPAGRPVLRETYNRM